MYYVVVDGFNSLAPGKFERNFRHVIFKQILMIDVWGFSCEIALLWMSLDFIDDQSTLVQVMAWCRQATSHCFGQFWPDLSRHMASLGHNELIKTAAKPHHSFKCPTVLAKFVHRNHWQRSDSVMANDKYRSAFSYRTVIRPPTIKRENWVSLTVIICNLQVVKSL